MLRQFRAYADEFLYSAFLNQAAYLTIKVGGRFATLEDVAQNERPSPPLMVGPAVHKVECYVKRVNVRII